MTFLFVVGILAIGAGLVAAVRLATALHAKSGSVELGTKEFLRGQRR